MSKFQELKQELEECACPNCLGVGKVLMQKQGIHSVISGFVRRAKAQALILPVVFL
ncbi:hypothetical protein P47N_0071 [Bacteriophage T5-like saus47N]|uniref:Uncharacterized protein n=6 Tax=Tequintavirus chee24 TaxID=2733981 RepID=A0A2K8HJ28_9CAUD|nr:hypothetical protein HOS38_gp146 [Escherichia phage chee24]ASU01678.1 hypothetical protein P27_0073 [Bacteriophage T5-like pork27]ASU01830.1 hypothetical protein P29_0072 [Bacteriophage T5-like pork29]ASU01981.1 hypothetical protein P47N_0071 [Bacteriophage T5-like saus47N]ASU02133.1 hypothetical protein P111K_0072 [Bacteriophage T5-like saus111K]ASU02284.1 hypothetical protein P124_0072 [Bacteriophage T5-like poul124]